MTSGTINPYQLVVIPTGIKINVPKNYYAQIFSRSGIIKKHAVVVQPGVIDQDFTGEINLLVINHGQHPFAFSKYDRLGQIVILKRFEGVVESFDEKGAKVIVNTVLHSGKRGDKGLGSTGGAVGLPKLEYKPC